MQGKRLSIPVSLEAAPIDDADNTDRSTIS
jgi:hypothetical protein